jgi:hypothetical protein
MTYIVQVDNLQPRLRLESSTYPPKVLAHHSPLYHTYTVHTTGTVLDSIYVSPLHPLRSLKSHLFLPTVSQLCVLAMC